LRRRRQRDLVGRRVIPSHGHGDHGISHVAAIPADVSQAVADNVTTSTMGLSRHYDENLLRSVADAGQGNYVFLEGPEQLVEAFEHELAGLGALRGRNVSLSATGGGVARLRHRPAVGVGTGPVSRGGGERRQS